MTMQLQLFEFDLQYLLLECPTGCVACFGDGMQLVEQIVRCLVNFQRSMREIPFCIRPALEGSDVQPQCINTFIRRYRR